MKKQKIDITSVSHTIFLLSQISMNEELRNTIYEDLIAFMEED